MLARRAFRAAAAFLHDAKTAADDAAHRLAGLRIVRERGVVHALLQLEAARLFRARGFVNVNRHGGEKLRNAPGVSKLARGRSGSGINRRASSCAAAATLILDLIPILNPACCRSEVSRNKIKNRNKRNKATLPNVATFVKHPRNPCYPQFFFKARAPAERRPPKLTAGA